MKQKFREIRLSKANKEKLDVINSIIKEYEDDGYTMTLRQLYYQLVSRDVIPNAQNEYSKVSKLLKEGRMAGIVDWGAIEDRLRVPYLPYWCVNVADALKDTAEMYRMNRQRGQDRYIEVWVEKDALSGVLKRVTSKYHVNLLVNRGYGSVTAMHDAYLRYKHEIQQERGVTLLYLGDHDPSGMDMIRDIRERISEMLGVDGLESAFSVDPIALTMDQIEQYNPPNNPAKLTDPRSVWYVEKYGYSSWEVDALEPKVLNRLVSDKIEGCIDMRTYREMLKREDADKAQLLKIAKEF